MIYVLCILLNHPNSEATPNSKITGAYSTPSEFVLPPHQRRRGYNSPGGEGGINISEDARHWIGLLQYNPSTVLPFCWLLLRRGKLVAKKRIIMFSPALPSVSSPALSAGTNSAISPPAPAFYTAAGGTDTRVERE
jgi:hypothetical protein